MFITNCSNKLLVSTSEWRVKAKSKDCQSEVKNVVSSLYTIQESLATDSAQILTVKYYMQILVK